MKLYHSYTFKSNINKKTPYWLGWLITKSVTCLKKTNVISFECSSNLEIGSPKGNRTPDTAVKGRCLNRLTMGPRHNSRLCQIANAIMNFLLGYSFSPSKLCFVGTPNFISAKCLNLKSVWWRWVESNYRSIGYEPIALTAEPHRRVNITRITKKTSCVKVFLKKIPTILK